MTIARGRRVLGVICLRKTVRNLVVSYHRAHTATIAPFLLGMSGLGGAMIRKSNKRRMSDFTDIEYLAEQAEGMHLTQRQADLLKVRF